MLLFVIVALFCLEVVLTDEKFTFFPHGFTYVSTHEYEAWYEHDNEAYIYWNRSDGRWWIDVPSGAGAYVSDDDQKQKIIILLPRTSQRRMHLFPLSLSLSLSLSLC